MDAWMPLLLALVTPAVGGVGWLIAQSWRRTERREARMIAMLEKQRDRAERERDEAKADADARIARAQEQAEARVAAERAEADADRATASQRVEAAEMHGAKGWRFARAYWQQLVAAGIEPVPPFDQEVTQ